MSAKESDPREEMLEHLPALRAFALSLTRNGATADDMVQDTVVKAWTNIEKFKVGTNLRAWLFTILRNTYYSSRRKLNREVSDPEGIMTNSLSVKPDHDGHLNLTDFRKAFETLPDEQREALILVGAAGHSYEDAAEICGVAVGTIKSRANRGRAKLTEILQLDGESPMEITDNATMAVVAGGGGVMR
jgi:RNA polymerase sigma-70 factor (ECF subfamily)